VKFVPDDQIVTMSPTLEVRRVEVTPCPMLDLIELRFREPDHTVTAEYIDRGEARKLLHRLAIAVGELTRALTAEYEAEEPGAEPAREEAGSALRPA
jgi:hypothetical protein